MSTVAQVNLWGSAIGAVALDDDSAVARFEYDPQFAKSGIQVAPLTMPLSERVYQFPSLAGNTFHGLPGLLADSLPDKFGNALIDAWLVTQGREPRSFNAIERLCYMGSRGMGALEFLPVQGPQTSKTQIIQVDALVALASDILSHRNELSASLSGDKKKQQALKQILQVGTSAGGARAKAVVAWNSNTNEVRSGQVKAGSGFEYWLLKFDGVSGNRDKELEDPKGYGLIEYAYYKMAIDAGIEMSECRLLKENNRQHFMTKRFDRLDNGEKLHMQSLCAMAHFDFNMPGFYSYEQAFQTIKNLDIDMEAVEQQFRRMAFNIIARNQDDHVKNIAFLMDKRGQWSLSPAFDVTYSYSPSGAWMASHQMSMNGKRDGFLMEDFIACEKLAGMKRGRAKTIVQEIREVVSGWRDYADDVGVNAEQRDKIQHALRLSEYA